MNSNPFVLSKELYNRDLNLVEQYLDQVGAYLSKMTGKSLVECKNYIRGKLKPGGQFEFKDPELTHTLRQDNGDREKTATGLLEYLNNAIKEKNLIAPTLTTYITFDRKPSLLVGFIDNNVKLRGAAKKKMFAAEMDGNTLVYVIQKTIQGNKKTSNNSLSGAHVSAGTPLFNKTAHSTMTSTCRNTSGYGNANNEKFLSGNRHYYSYHVVRNNISSIIRNVDYDLIEQVIKKYNLVEPSIEQTMECIDYSARLYWRSSRRQARLRRYVSKLTGLERAAFVYVGDLYHLMKFNDDFVRGFLTELSARVPNTEIDPNLVMKETPEEYHHLATQICPDEMKGKKIKDVMGTEIFPILAGTVNNIDNTIEKYKDMIEAFWVTPNVPSSVAYFPSSIRRAALVSDTDSTIFTVQDWVKWYCGKITFSNAAMAVSASVIFLTSQTITHVLARMSGNFGVETKRIHQIAMKNEFKFDVFIVTQVAKHYFALIGCQEGNLFAKYKDEIKGVHLKSSNAPKRVMAQAKEMMLRIMNTVLEEKTISIMDLIKEVADLERSIVESIKLGKSEFLRMGQIKPAMSYTKEEADSPYNQYLLWNEVFGPKYGYTPAPPYTSLKVSTTINSPRDMADWITSIVDKELADRLVAWLKKYNKNKFGTFLLPDQIISSIGIPEEIFQVIDTRKIVADTTGVFYVIIEALGQFIRDDKKTRLFFDNH